MVVTGFPDYFCYDGVLLCIRLCIALISILVHRMYFVSEINATMKYKTTSLYFANCIIYNKMYDELNFERLE